MIIALIIFISIVAIWEYRKRQKRIAAGELIPVPVTNHSEGLMLKAIKVTMGICFGLFLFALLLAALETGIVGTLLSK